MKTICSGAAAAVILALLTSCNPGSTGLFAGIEAETKIVANGDLAVKATVTSMAEDSTDQYAVGSGVGGAKLYSRKVATLGTWSADTTITTDILAVAGQGDNKVYRIRATTSGNVVEWKGPSPWTKVTLNTTDNPVNLVPVIAADGHSVESVLVVTQRTSDNSYQNLYLLKGTVTPVGPIDLASGSTLSTPVTSAAALGSGYIFVNRSSFWSAGVDLASPTTVTTTGVSEYAAVLNVSGVDSSIDGIYLATRRVGSAGGTLVVGSLTGSTFTSTSIATNAKDSSSALLDFTTLIVPPGTSPKHLLAGTATSGFGELDKTTWTSTPSAATVDVNNYSVSSLPGAPVLFFFVSPTPASTGKLYLGTNSMGLWSQKTDKTWSN